MRKYWNIFSSVYHITTILITIVIIIFDVQEEEKKRFKKIIS